MTKTKGSVENVNNSSNKKQKIECPYLDTVNRKILDFDFEKQCSVSLSHLNVYACLVCGKYFQGKFNILISLGRGVNSHAYFHSMDKEHHVFVNLSSCRFYCLPDNYEIIDRSLDDVKLIIQPEFSEDLIKELDTNKSVAKEYQVDLSDTKYLSGFLGFNNLKANDYFNVVVYCLAHVSPLRNFFLLKKEEKDNASELLKRFGLLVRKIWNKNLFKGHVSPHELMQEVTNRSHKKFLMTEKSDMLTFLMWFLNTLNLDLKKIQTENSKSILERLFQGRLSIYSKNLDLIDDVPQLKSTEFFFLSLDLPPVPVFTDLDKNVVVKQVNLVDLLKKYDGETRVVQNGIQRIYTVEKLPEFLILAINRFQKNAFRKDKNNTIVNYPLEALDFGVLLDGDKKKDVMIYDLMINIVHEGDELNGFYKVQLYNKAMKEWFQIHDLNVEPLVKDTMFLADTCLQVWELRK